MRASRGIAAERDVPFERVTDRTSRVAIPLPFFSVPVNVWILRLERPLIVDSGPKTDDARARIEAGFKELGLEPESLGHVFLSHHHVDHSGLLHEWIARSGATALVHEDDLDQALDVEHAIERRLRAYVEMGRRWGLSEAESESIAANLRTYARFGGLTPADRARRLVGARVPLEVPGAKLVALHCPGHTEGQALLFDEDRHELYAGDHVLERITPNPNVYVPPYRGRTTGLGDYLRSIDGLRALPEDTLVLPGHGAAFRGLHARLDAIAEAVRERREQVLRVLERGEQTVAAIAGALFQGLKETHLALAAREVHGHLDLLVEEGLVLRAERDGAWHWRRAA